MPIREAEAGDSGVPLFVDGEYPTQLKYEVDRRNYDGEFRGLYAGDTDSGSPQDWRPGSSTPTGRNPNHGALDIYAPFAPHPLETPVCAIIQGTLVCRSGEAEPNGIWNRAEIHFDNGRRKLSYGHLSRFEGRSRTVNPGDVIGFAGCSGNADTKGECTECGDCNINSGHVHLTEWHGSTKISDPRARTGLRLRFASGDVQDLDEKRTCAKLLEQGHGRAEKWTPSDPDGSRPRLLGDVVFGTPRRKDGRGQLVRQSLPSPFTHLEFTDQKLLSNSQKFYALCNARVGALASGGDAVKAFLKTRQERAVVELRSEMASRLERLRASIIQGDAIIGLGDPIDRQKVAEWTLRHLSYLNQMLWTVLCGPALTEFSSNVAGLTGKKRYQAAAILNLADNSTLKLEKGSLLECAGGISGEAWMSATSGYARTAIQKSWFSETLASGKTRKDPVVGVTFGAGSLMHATISTRMKDATLGGTKGSEEIEELIKGFVDKGLAAQRAIASVNLFCGMNAVSLSGTISDPAQDIAIAELVSLIRAAVTALEEALLEPKLAAMYLNDPDAETKCAEAAFAILARIAASNEKLFGKLIQKIEATNQGDEEMFPLAPLMFSLKSGRTS
ncbi:M23 family metallopeptidase [uncultured Erythrobacter sp.]|uniref:M23 family metallopeptidase n=1 Tax=uncultured Erythrobacter sp. TaxID=263913 RepID=UPI0026037C33|nr:M23 family metallopeptidase [uncultured Erythrobacter sp.]